MEQTINLYRPGTIWQRTRRGKTSTVLLLGTTNEHLTDKVKAKYPEMTVFMDSKGRWCSLPSDVFKEDRVLLKTDVNAEANLLNLLEPRVNVESLESQAQTDELEIEVNEEELAETNLQFLSINNDDLSATILPALVTYNLRPSLEGNATLVHELILDPDVLSESEASRLFTDTSLDTITDISVNGQTYVIHRYLGSYPIIIEGGQSSYYTVYLSTNLDVQVADVAEQLADTPIEEEDAVVSLSELVNELTFEESQVLYSQLITKYPALLYPVDMDETLKEEPVQEIVTEETINSTTDTQQVASEEVAAELKEVETVTPTNTEPKQVAQVQDEQPALEEVDEPSEPNVNVPTDSTLEVTASPEANASNFVSSFREILNPKNPNN